MKTIAIIGAGAAGLMTAASILENTPKESSEYRILLFEKNASPGKKVIISWGGRCNITTTVTDKKILSSKYIRGWGFIKKSMGKFSPKKTYEWFESHGIPLKIEWERVFPESNDGHDVVDMFTNFFRGNQSNISIHYREATEDIQKHNEQFIVTTSRNIYHADIVVITTGGNAYAHTGSTGDGYFFGKNLGHTVTQLWPSLSSFLIEETWIQILSGLAFENAKITHSTDHAISWSVLFTHFGISWPLAFMLASHLAWEDIIWKQIHISPLADMQESEWDHFLRKSFEQFPKRLLPGILETKLPKRFVEALLQAHFPTLMSTIVSGISKKHRESIAKLLGKWIPLTITGRRPWDEFVTAGGIDTDEINPDTMESKITKNLYFAGEILNVDGYTGGFSLQICWSSGYTAGKHIAKILSEEP